MKKEDVLKIKQIIGELEKIRGRHTELISVYVPAGYNLVEITNQLIQEKSTAMNIKSKATRKNVLAALEKILNHLKLFKQTPPNGLIIFCGNISKTEGREDIRLWSFEPPEKMNVKVYWCDQVFVLEPLKDLIREKEVYGLIVLDAREANIGLLKGKQIVPVKRFESTVPSKTVKGGMCLYYKTKVVLNNGNEKQINKIRVGDKLISFDLEKNEIFVGECKKVFKRRLKEAFQIVFDGGRIIASEDHKFFIKKEKIEEKFVSELKRGEKLIYFKNGKLKESFIKNIQKVKVPEGTFFYDLEISPHPNYFAANILVHNSQARYDRLRESAIHEFLTKIGEKASEVFLEQKDLKGVIIGGPGPIKEKFAKGEYLHYQIRKKVLGIKDISYTSEYGLKELVNKAKDLLAKTAMAKEKELLEKFFTELKRGGNVVYGIEKTIGALEKGAVDILLMSEDFDLVEVTLKCRNQHRIKKILPKKEIKEQRCEICNNPLEIEKEEELSKKLIEKAKKYGTTIELISTSTEEGKEFKHFGGIGGFLRYKIQL